MTDDGQRHRLIVKQVCCQPAFRPTASAEQDRLRLLALNMAAARTGGYSRLHHVNDTQSACQCQAASLYCTAAVRSPA